MADFTNNQIRNTYQRVLQITSTGIVQNGTGSAALGDIHTSGSLYHTGSIDVSGNATIPNITGSTTVAGTATANEGLIGAFFSNPQTINYNVNIPASHNARMFGAATVAAGKTLTVGSSAKLEIIDI